MKSRALLVITCVAIGFSLNSVTIGDLPSVAADCPGEPGTVCGNGDVNGDGFLDISDVLYLARSLFMEDREIVSLGCASGGRLPATGQATCYDNVTPANVIECGSSDFPGQGGSYQLGCPRDGRFIDNGDGTVDNSA